MWDDIKMWALCLYFSIGFTVGLIVPSLAGREMDIFSYLGYTIIFLVAWLPIVIIGLIIQT